MGISVVSGGRSHVFHNRCLISLNVVFGKRDNLDYSLDGLLIRPTLRREKPMFIKVFREAPLNDTGRSRENHLVRGRRTSPSRDFTMHNGPSRWSLDPSDDNDWSSRCWSRRNRLWTKHRSRFRWSRRTKAYYTRNMQNLGVDVIVTPIKGDAHDYISPWLGRHNDYFLQNRD